ncbi:MAG: sulfatase-like hydrolase/transferase [Chromatiales bacterium]|jgi:arylsulfatase A-like enzyme|nr:sulfatase-like hydrolase/transferase [Chromatiales bacterium]
MSKRPNFLFFMTDQHRADWLGCAGHPVVRTPHIDALAANGTRFERFYVASPVCMPNRASLMTGRFPTAHGLRYNGCLLPTRANTFVDVLRAGGYQTASIGKSHLQPFTLLPPVGRPMFQTGPIVEAWQEEDEDYGQEQPDRYQSKEPYVFRTPYYGFDHVDMVVDHGDLAEGHYLQWMRNQTDDWEALRDRANQLPHNYSCPQAYRTAIPEHLYSTAYIRDQACNWLGDLSAEDAPFFTFVSFPDPHHPFTPPGKYWDMYDPDDFEITLPYSAHQNPPMPMRAVMEAALRGDESITPQTAFALQDERPLREAMALTAGMITMIDDAIGAVMDALRASGQADNTIVCFNADHGDYLGDFNLMLKGALSSDAINRVPFIWSDPTGASGATSGALASTIDIASTVLERAELDPYFGLQGRSLLSHMAGEPGQSHREDLLIEFNDGMPRMGFATPARVRTLVSSRWRMSVYEGQDWGELYDRSVDPNDTNNLWDDPAYLADKAALSVRLNHLMIGAMDESPRSQRVA